jgi:diguanylate cyclase (GGDEF)-like protein
MPLTGTKLTHLCHAFESEISAHPDRQCSVLCFDLDLFARVSEEHGQLAADALIERVIEAASKIGSAFYWGDFMDGATPCGDEFAILLPHTSKATALTAACRLRRALRDLPIPVRASIGIATYPDDGKCPLRVLDTALIDLIRLAKRNGRDTIAFADAHGAALLQFAVEGAVE